MMISLLCCEPSDCASVVVETEKTLPDPLLGYYYGLEGSCVSHFDLFLSNYGDSLLVLLTNVNT